MTWRQIFEEIGVSFEVLSSGLVIQVVYGAGKVVSIGNRELDEIAQMSPACWDNRYALPVISLTIQAQAITPTLSISLRHWAKRHNLFFTDVPRGNLPN